jgi:hypothetical protein
MKERMRKKMLAIRAPDVSEHVIALVICTLLVSSCVGQSANLRLLQNQAQQRLERSSM